MMMRSSVLAGSALILRTRSIPLTSGRSISMIAISKRSLRAAEARSSASAAAPFSASPTRTPQLSSWSFRLRRRTALSSMTRTAMPWNVANSASALFVASFWRPKRAVKRNVEPRVGSLVRSIVPPIISQSCFAMLRPSPVPP